MNFEDTNSEVVAFYTEFHKTFSEVDKKFQKLDEMGGVDQSIAKEIICDLLRYHSNVYKETPLSTDEEVFSVYKEYVNKKDNAIEEYASIVKKIQQTVHDFLIYDMQWSGQKEYQEIIENVLNVFSQELTVTSEQENSYYATIRILRELVADCAISIKGLYPLAKWSYGTIEYSHLTANEQLVVLINQSILIDRMYFCLQSLEITLNRLNKLVDGFEKLDWTVYYVVGFLNFKIHQYSNAVSYFKKVKEHNELKKSYEQSVREHYFHANLLIAYSYEYGHDFDKAIKVLAIDPNQIVLITEQYAIDLIDSKFIEIMDEICMSAKENEDSLVCQYMSSYSDFFHKANKPFLDNDSELEHQFEILHALAHCINEYAIKNLTEKQKNDSINYGKIIRLARCIMKNIALIRPEYWTCYATIHGEYQDYHKALYELDNAQNKLISYNNGIGKETLIAEVSFFRYYFNLLCNRVSKDDKESFERYYEKYDDDDAKCHLKIFEFRDELRRYLSALYNSLYNLSDGSQFNEDTILMISDDLQEKYNELCSLEPTLYMNANVRTELRLMQRAYICIQSLRTYLIVPSPDNLINLRNSAYRFSIIKDEFKFKDNVEHDDFKDDILSLLPEIVRNVFSARNTSILSSLFCADSIFILAPISGVVVYQYQTGTVQELFESKTILPHINEVTCKYGDIEKIIHTLFGVYSKFSETAVQREIINIDWNELSQYADVIYFWSNDEMISSQILVSEKGASSYIRQIEDVKTFTETMAQLKRSFDTDQKRVLCKDKEVRSTNRRLKCTLQLVKLPWLEIVNESNENCLFYIAWDDDLEGTTDRDTIRCFMLPYVYQRVPERCDSHKCEKGLHQYIRQIRVKYKSDDTNMTFKSVLEQDEVVHNDKELLEIVSEIKELANVKKDDIKHELDLARSQLDNYKKDLENANSSPIKKKIEEYNCMLLQIESIIERTNQDISKMDISDLENYQNILSQIEVN